MPLQRIIQPSIEVIESLSALTPYSFTFNGHHLNDREFELEKSESFFRFETSSVIIKGLQTHDELKFGKNEEYVLEGTDRKLYVHGKDLFINNIFYTNDNRKLLSGDLYSFSDAPQINRPDLCYRRFVHPMNDEKFPIAEFQCREVNFDGRFFSGYIPLTIDDADFYLYNYRYKSKNYLCIDSSKLLAINEFQKNCYNILLAIAFVKGELYHNEAFIQSFSDPDMNLPEETTYFSMRTSLKTQQPTFTTNMHWLYKDKLVYNDDGTVNQIARSMLYDDIYNFSFQTLSRLATASLHEEKVQRAIILYLHGHVATLEIRLPNYFVAIEALSSYVVSIKGKNNRLNPIKDKKTASQLQEQFIEQLTKIKADKGLSDAEFDLDILVKNINKMNSPPNADKLSESFTLLDYDLGDERKMILKDRNSFLHGSFIRYIDDEDAFQKALYIGLRVQFMIAVLILKSADFEGKIINYASFWQSMTKHPLDEDYNIKI